MLCAINYGMRHRALSIVTRPRSGDAQIAISGTGTKYFLFSQISRSALRPIQPPIKWLAEFFPRGYSGRGVNLNTHLQLVPKLKMSGAETLLPVCVFMALAGTVLLFLYIVCVVQ